MKTDLIKWYRLRFERLYLKKIDFFFHFRWRPEVTAEMLNPLSATPIERSVIPENFTTLSFTVLEKTAGQNDFLKTENRPYLPTGSEISKNKKTEFSSCYNTSSLKISWKSIEPFLRNRRHKKRKKNNNKNKPYNL